MHQDFAEVGARCVDVLVERMGAADRWFQGRPVVVPGRLVVRASTGPVPR
ncbi:unannotated protein [freshwater metagenome]|uniref:Unannotated protein n=1 Tax=freshwater metagenome TaxID=449393 RepID=A0A6J7H7D8_9ZZZZ